MKRLPGGCVLSPFAHGPMCNIISAIIRLPTPVSARGNTNCWNLSDPVREQVLPQLMSDPPPPRLQLRHSWCADLPRMWPLPWLQGTTVERGRIQAAKRPLEDVSGVSAKISRKELSDATGSRRLQESANASAACVSVEQVGSSESGLVPSLSQAPTSMGCCKLCNSTGNSKKFTRGPKKGQAKWVLGLCNKCYQKQQV